MKPIELKIENFMGAGIINYKFPENNDIFLVQGINSSSSSNGAGKSTIFVDSILWCLYGITKRGLTGDDVINRFTDDGCFVSLEFNSDSNNIYRVQRSRKHSIHKSNLFIYNNDGNNIAKGTQKLTQEFLEKDILKQSASTFMRANFFGQGDLKPFANLSDAELKEVFEQSLGLTIFKEKFIKIKTIKKNKELEIMEAKSNIEKLKHEFYLKKEQITSLENIILNMDINFSENLNRIRERIKLLALDKEMVCKDINKEDSGFNELKQGNESLEKIATELNELNEQKNELKNYYEKEREKLILSVNKQKQIKAEIDKKIKEIQDADAKKGTKCNNCGQVFNSKAIDDYILLNKMSSKELEEEYNRFCDKYNEDNINEIKEKVKFINDAIENKKQDTEKIRMEEQKYKLKKQEAKRIEENLIAQIEKAKQEEDNLKNNHDIMKDNKNKALSENKGYIARIREDIIEKTKQMEKLKQQLETINQLYEILGNSGIKNYLLNSITPELNRLANKYLRCLNPDIEVEISTFTKLKSGELKDKFNINVINRNGGDSFKGNSGGEKQIIDLAIALAFNNIVRDNNAFLMVLDEPFESLDPFMAENAINLISDILQEIKSSIYVISHNENIKDLIHNKIYVKKEDGMAFLVDKY